jgi:hypothetical protein
LGLLPWLAPFFFRLRRLRARFDIFTPRYSFGVASAGCLRACRARVNLSSVSCVPNGGCPACADSVALWLDWPSHRFMAACSRHLQEAPPMAEEIRAEIVGNVLKVVAKQGEDLGIGDMLVILESMKMEIPVLTESAGTLMKLVVNEGDVVQEGDLLAVIE